jgi:hypothetical protein
MDVLQLVFAFVNAPLFATFALGMFWRRTTGHGAFVGLVSGTLAAAIHHGLTLPAGAVPGVKGGYFGVLHVFPSELAQTFWTAIAAFTTCAVVTTLVTLVTRPRPDAELRGLVYSLTPRAGSTDGTTPRRSRSLAPRACSAPGSTARSWSTTRTTCPCPTSSCAVPSCPRRSSTSSAGTGPTDACYSTTSNWAIIPWSSWSSMWQCTMKTPG